MLLIDGFIKLVNQ